MLNVKLICAGKLKEPYLIAAAAEYEKRIGAFFKYELREIPESAAAGPDAGLSDEARGILPAIPNGAFTIALCVEGERLSSIDLAKLFIRKPAEGFSRLCFVVGGSNGLHESVKTAAQLRLSMSDMTFPHHLARVMLLEQIYRAGAIGAGLKYHK